MLTISTVSQTQPSIRSKMGATTFQPYTPEQSIYHSRPGETEFDIPDMSAEYGPVWLYTPYQRNPELLKQDSETVHVGTNADFLELELPLPMELRLGQSHATRMTAMKNAIDQADDAVVACLNTSPRTAVLRDAKPEERYRVVQYIRSTATPAVESQLRRTCARAIKLGTVLGKSMEQARAAMPKPRCELNDRYQFNWEDLVTRAAVPNPRCDLNDHAQGITWAELVSALRHLVETKKTLKQMRELVDRLERERSMQSLPLFGGKRLVSRAEREYNAARGINGAESEHSGQP